ncbi:MAG: hypothetical protein L0H79_08180 [Intrasporangium sp.]|uniref:hypothetical protein n=1 Tax=Intrasporangium sp. TaxID=1925024 RepID=UPI002647172F|nr:hypothetical protein [Intrasporangium sp.]MDN5795715.1 hypothetical protein [Intrasporangium sp.]
MESPTPPPCPHEAHAELAAADRARDRLAARLRLPSGLHPALAVAVAVQVGTAGVGIAQQTAAGLALLFAGLAVFLMTAAWSLHRFRVINGVRVDGLASQVVLGADTTSSLVYLGSFGAATWAAFASAWWLVAVAAVAGGTGYALGARRWWHAYRSEPAAHAVGASPRLLAGLAVIACLGLAVLLVLG